MIINLAEDLKQNSYPGRGIIAGLTADGKQAVIAYFIMGRSENSRNRIFVNEGENMKTEAYDPAKMVDPSLIIYYPVRVCGKTTVVTNGDQTDTVADFIGQGKTFEQALNTREFEPDAPNFTPRISAELITENGQLSYNMSILKSAYGNGASCQRFFFEYPQPVAGTGHFIHTYKCDGDPIPSFEGEPKQVDIPNDIDAFSGLLWNNLNEDNKVSLFVRYIDLSTGETESRIINKNN